MSEHMEEIQRWFDHLEWTREKSRRIQGAAALAREGKRSEAKEIVRQIDSQPRVYDGARLEEAVKALVEEVEALRSHICSWTHPSGSGGTCRGCAHD